MPIKSSQTSTNLRRLPTNFTLKDRPLFSLHEIDDFLGWDLSTVDIEWIAHGVLTDEVEDLHAFDAVLLVDEEV